MNVICVTRLNAALYQMGAATKQATKAIEGFNVAMFEGSKLFPKKERRRIGRMIRRGKIVRNGKVTLA